METTLSFLWTLTLQSRALHLAEDGLLDFVVVAFVCAIKRKDGEERTCVLLRVDPEGHTFEVPTPDRRGVAPGETVKAVQITVLCNAQPHPQRLATHICEKGILKKV